MTVPVLRRMLARPARPAHLESAEVEQEALAAVATALRTMDPGVERLDRELFSAADRAVHRLVYAARRHATRETGANTVPLDHLCSTSQADHGEPVDELTVLARAVQARVLDVAEARLSPAVGRDSMRSAIEEARQPPTLLVDNLIRPGLPVQECPLPETWGRAVCATARAKEEAT